MLSFKTDGEKKSEVEIIGLFLYWTLQRLVFQEGLGKKKKTY
jgi:hypothetical protein